MCNLTINELHNRNLDKCYFVIMCFKTKINIMEGDEISKKDIYIFYGCNILGVRKFLDICIVNNFTKPSDWYNFLLKLKKRNVETVLYANIPNNKILKDSLMITFKDIKVFISCYEPIDTIFKYFNARYDTHVFSIIKNIYLSDNIDGYNSAVSIFKEEFNNSPFLYDILEKDLTSIKKYYNFDIILRKHIFCFYFYREMRKKIYTASHAKYYFNTTDELLESLISHISIMESRCYCPKKEWLNLINFIYSSNKDLIKNYL
ncbi:MAG: transposase [Bacilli bacterium]|nr:transposase [Bacilli bacterium]